MPLTSADLKFFGSAVMPDDDTATDIGGAINTSKKVEFTDITPAGTVEMLSSDPGDTTQSVTITYRDTGGSKLTEVRTLNGTTVVPFAATMDRILKVVMSATAVGAVTIRKTAAGGDLVLLEPGVVEVRRPFFESSAPTSGTRRYYEKIFARNTHATLTLLAAQVSEQADPVGKIAFGLPATKDDTGTNGPGNNRQVAPGGIAFDSLTKSVPGNQLEAGSAIGIWLELTLLSTDAPQDTTVTMRLSGNST